MDVYLKQDGEGPRTPERGNHRGRLTLWASGAIRSMIAYRDRSEKQSFQTLPPWRADGFSAGRTTLVTRPAAGSTSPGQAPATGRSDPLYPFGGSDCPAGLRPRGGPGLPPGLGLGRGGSRTECRLAEGCRLATPGRQAQGQRSDARAPRSPGGPERALWPSFQVRGHRWRQHGQHGAGRREPPRDAREPRCSVPSPQQGVERIRALLGGAVDPIAENDRTTRGSHRRFRTEVTATANAVGWSLENVRLGP